MKTPERKFDLEDRLIGILIPIRVICKISIISNIRGSAN